MRPVSLKTKTSVALVEREIAGDRINIDGTISQGVDTPLLPEKEKSYTTKWLGRCDYKVYIFPESNGPKDSC